MSTHFHFILLGTIYEKDMMTLNQNKNIHPESVAFLFPDSAFKIIFGECENTFTEELNNKLKESYANINHAGAAMINSSLRLD